MKIRFLITVLLFVGIVSNIFPQKLDSSSHLASKGVHTPTPYVVDIHGKIFENPPDTIPKIFAKDIISVLDRFEYGLVISPNWDELFFTAEQPNG